MTSTTHDLSDLNLLLASIEPVLSRAHAPIGVFDSGMGGLSIVQELQAHLPNESIIYLADTKNVPYGQRTDSEICQLTSQAVAWLHQQGCKAVVVACNTASAFSLTYLRDYYGADFPIIGLVPAVKPAVLKTQSKVVGVLATPGTLRGSLLKDVIDQVAKPAGVKVITVVSPALVPFVERGMQNSDECKAELNAILWPLQQAGVDYLVLGCTHYPFLKASIAAAFGSQFILIDSGNAVARQTGRVLSEQKISFPTNGKIKNKATLQCFVTGSIQQAQPVLNDLMRHTGQLAPVVEHTVIENSSAAASVCIMPIVALAKFER